MDVIIRDYNASDPMAGVCPDSYDSDKTPATNEMLVKRLVRLAGEIGRPVATAAETQKILGLKDG